MTDENSDKKNGIDMEVIRKMASILNETNLSDIEVEQDGVRIRVSRTLTIAAQPQAVYANAGPGDVSGVAAADSAAGGKAAQNLKNTVTSPMVGTAYLAPAPGARPFVEAGQHVKQGDTLLIVEAMKTMNHIPAPRSGVVKTVLVANEQPVEFGEALIILE